MNAKRFFGSMLLAIAGGIAAVLIYTAIDKKEPAFMVQETPSMQYVNLPPAASIAPTNFVVAAESAVDAVVHVKTKAYREGSSGNPFYDFFFGYRGDGEQEPVLGFGSGVILSADGYIVTNNHVIEGSEEVEVILNDKRSFDAKILGTDPSTDLAVLKIRENGLPFLEFGNSDNLRLGEWVLAVGNPYNLTSTVTAGIVSAKARNINILNEQLAIESFIQTDAAVNPGNSGGALVNTNGDLVGINAAIASRTGAFTGYSFAIPASIVQKIVEDMIEYGAVQRAFIGVTIQELDAETAEQNNIDEIAGVLVTSLRPNGAAIDAGIEVNDVITAVNGVRVNSPSELQEQVGRYRPNDKISVTINRKNRVMQMDVVLRNLDGGTGIVEREEAVTAFGASFEELSQAEKRNLGINNGVRVIDVNSGKFRNKGIREGFVITEINNHTIKEPDDIKSVVEGADEGIYIEGIYPDGSIAYYAIEL